MTQKWHEQTTENHHHFVVLGSKCFQFLPTGNAYPSGHIVPSLLGLAHTPIVQTIQFISRTCLSFFRLLTFGTLGTFSNLLFVPTLENHRRIQCYLRLVHLEYNVWASSGYWSLKRVLVRAIHFIMSRWSVLTTSEKTLDCHNLSLCMQFGFNMFLFLCV